MITNFADTELIGRFNAGDESAFAEIMRRHRDKILSIAQGVLHNHADAEEIAQDTFVHAYRKLSGFRGDSSLSTWLYRIATNLARNRYWYFFRRKRHLTFPFDSPFGKEDDTTIGDLIAGATADPATENARMEFSALIAAAMTRLDSSQRDILALRNLRDLSYVEIAQLRGIALGTVKSRIARAREHLRALIAEACPEFAPDAAPAAWLENARQSGRVVPASHPQSV